MTEEISLEEQYEQRISEIYEAALELVKVNGKVTLGVIQKKFKIGYVPALKLMDNLESEGKLKRYIEENKRYWVIVGD